MAQQQQIVCIDNGSWEIRAGFGGDGAPRVVAPNCTARPNAQLRVLVADEIFSMKNAAQLEFSRPLQRGVLVNAGCEHDVWRRVIESGLGTTARQVDGLVCSESPMTSPSSKTALDELIFEDFEFRSAVVAPAAWLAAAAGASRKRPGRREALVVVDCGHASTMVVPTVQGRCVSSGIRRLDVAGQLLTGYLRELVSYRQYNMMDETVVLDRIKTQLAYLAPNFEGYLASCKDGVTSEHAEAGDYYAEYVLPDYHTIQEGYPRMHTQPPTFEKKQRIRRTRTDETPQFLRLESERFCVPELLFSPQDVGIPQAGLHELIADALQATESHLQTPLSARVLLCGGSAKIPGLEDRLRAQLRPLIPDTRPLLVETAQVDYDQESSTSNNASYYSYNTKAQSKDDTHSELLVFQGAALLAAHPSYQARATTRAYYLEHGRRKNQEAFYF